MILPFFHQPYVCTYYHHKLSNQHHVAWPRHLFFLYVDHKFLIFYQFLDYILLGFLNHYTDLYTDALYFCNLLLVSESSHFSVLLGIRVISASPIHFTQNQYFFSQVSIILANVVYYKDTQFHYVHFSSFFVIFQSSRIWGQWEMLLWPGEWVVYCNDSYNSKSTTINFAFDTKTGCSWNSNIQFTNQYGYNSMVDYNPRERVLYARDNRRLVTYPITEIWEILSSLCDQQVLGLKNADQ